MTDNPFRRFWDFGFKRLVPIIPPVATVFETLVDRAARQQ